MTTADHRPPVPADISRSWTLVPATRPELFARVASSLTDQLILDVEDAVDPGRKDEARDNVVAWLTDAPADVWVRINAAPTPFWEPDVQALRGVPHLAGVMLAKTESAAEVEATSSRLGLPVVALVESALGVEEATAIARAEGAFRLAFGSGDYRRDTGTSADDLAMAYPRSRLVVSSRIGGLPGPIDGPTIGTSHGVLREAAGVAVALGMTGKLCLDVEQLPVINEVISPTRSDVLWARQFMTDFAARGGVVRDGSDLPRLGRAQKIEKLATAFGVSIP